MRTDYARIEAAIHFLNARFDQQPALAEVARALDLSPYHFQRLFRRFAGVSPKRFVQYLTADYARGLLARSRPVLDAALAAGLSSPGRLHDLMVTLHAMTPGEIGNGGEALTIAWGEGDTPFGRAWVAATARGVCALHFCSEQPPEAAEACLRKAWPRARIVRRERAARALLRRAFAPEPRLALHVRGTNFQIKVWEALLAIPPGALTSYGIVADHVGAPRSQRAVGLAVGSNPVAHLIPCHRVIRADGALGGYRWGEARKRAMLAREAACAPRRGHGERKARYVRDVKV